MVLLGKTGGVVVRALFVQTTLGEGRRFYWYSRFVMPCAKLEIRSLNLGLEWRVDYC